MSEEGHIREYDVPFFKSQADGRRGFCMRKKKGLSFGKKRRRIKMSAVQGALLWIGECALAFAVGCVLIFYFMTGLTCVGQAMEPTISSGDMVFVNRFIYSVTSPGRGDVIVFKPNGNENTHYYMRRVIGVPGDTIQIIDGFVYVNGELYEMGIGTSEQMDFAGVAEEELTLDKDEYFVLGDNRNASEDSRNADIGNVKKTDIYGKAWFIFSPWENFGLVTKVK